MIAMLRFRVGLFLGLTLFATRGAVAQPSPIDLGTLGGSFSYPSGVNDRGQVVGTSTTVGNDLLTGRAFLWTPVDGMVDLGTLGSATSGASAVNDRGQVVGTSRTHGLLPVDGFHAFLWTAQDGMADLHSPPPGGLFDSYAGAINNQGRVVGTYDHVTRGFRAFSWTATDGMIDLGTLGGRMVFPSAVNNRDQVVGTSYVINDLNPYGPRHAFSWTPAGGMVDLGTLGGPSSGAEALNEKGSVVGW
jgi:probable HAF family extracellular repeat protein